jgi:hypothetical protein
MGARLSRMFDPEYRARVHKDYPNLKRKTLFISVGTLIPYALTFAVLADLLRGRVASAGKRTP